MDSKGFDMNGFGDLEVQGFIMIYTWLRRLLGHEAKSGGIKAFCNFETELSNLPIGRDFWIA